MGGKKLGHPVLLIVIEKQQVERTLVDLSFVEKLCYRLLLAPLCSSLAISTRFQDAMSQLRVVSAYQINLS
jgi:hypothetical protein